MRAWDAGVETMLLSVQSEMVCLRVLMGTVMVLTSVIYGTEVWVENRIAVDSYIEPAGAAKKKKVPSSLILNTRTKRSEGLHQRSLIGVRCISMERACCHMQRKTSSLGHMCDTYMAAPVQHLVLPCYLPLCYSQLCFPCVWLLVSSEVPHTPVSWRAQTSPVTSS